MACRPNLSSEKKNRERERKGHVIAYVTTMMMFDGGLQAKSMCRQLRKVAYKLFKTIRNV
jgi:hypothetical protein